MSHQSKRRLNLLVRNDLANGNHWIEIDLEGTTSNRSAIGARVEVWTGGQRQIREVQGCTGFRSQNALTVHFGLGAAAVVDSIKLRWPSGITQDTTAIPANLRYTITEGHSLVGVGPSAPVVNFALAVSPQPVHARARVTFVLATPSHMTLVVHDLAGRRVRALLSGTGDAGLNQLTWDGTGDAGHRLAPGVYYLQLTTPGGASSRPVLLLDP